MLVNKWNWKMVFKSPPKILQLVDLLLVELGDRFYEFLSLIGGVLAMRAYTQSLMLFVVHWELVFEFPTPSFVWWCSLQYMKKERVFAKGFTRVCLFTITVNRLWKNKILLVSLLWWQQHNHTPFDIKHDAPSSLFNLIIDTLSTNQKKNDTISIKE